MNNTVDNAPSITTPLVTFALFLYNQKKYAKEAMEGALAQTYGPLEILIFDDCSSDGTPEIIKNMINNAKDLRRIKLYENKINKGLTSQINSAMKEAKGRLIVVAAGDDFSFSDRVEKIVTYWVSAGEMSGSIFSSFKTINDAGVVRNHPVQGGVKEISLGDKKIDELRSISMGTRGCTHAWTKDFFDYFGPMDDEIIHEDITIPLRSLMLGKIVHLPDELVLYRISGNSQSRIAFSSANERMRKMARYWRGRVANYKQFEKDSTLAMSDNLLSKEDFIWMNDVINEERAISNYYYNYFSASALKRIILAADFSTRIPGLIRIKMAVLALFPFLYRYKRNSG